VRKVIPLPGVASARSLVSHPPQLLTIEEAAQYLRVCTKTVRTRIREGTLPATKVGSQYRLSMEGLKSYLARGLTG
jgi:excisionase family DNA binding protein